MDDMKIRFYRPVTTGIVMPQMGNASPKVTNEEPSASFQDILNGKIAKNSEVNFSKHAAERVVERNIELSDERLNRLNEGVKLASSKNINDALILVDDTAFIVNTINNTVITTKDKDEIKSNVFTNINGTVII